MKTAGIREPFHFLGIKISPVLVSASNDSNFVFECFLVTCNTVIPRYNAPRYNADLAITRFFTPKFFLPHLLRKGEN